MICKEGEEFKGQPLTARDVEANKEIMQEREEVQMTTHFELGMTQPKI